MRTLIKKIVYIFLCVLPLYSINLFSKECFEAGESFDLPASVNSFDITGQAASYRMNPDKTQLMSYNPSGDTISVYDLKTHVVKEFKKSMGAHLAWTKDNKILVTEEPPLSESESESESELQFSPMSAAVRAEKYFKGIKSKIIDPKNGAETVLPKGTYYSNGKFFTSAGFEGKDIVVIKAKDGTIEKRNYGSTISSADPLVIGGSPTDTSYYGYLNLAKKSVTIKKHGIIVKTAAVEVPVGEMKELLIGPDGKILLINSNSGSLGKNNEIISGKDITIYDLENKKQKTFPIPFETTIDPRSPMSKDTSMVILSQNDGFSKTVVMNLKTGEIKKLSDDNLTFSKFTDDGKLCGVYYKKEDILRRNIYSRELPLISYKCIDIKTGNIASDIGPIPISLNSGYMGGSSFMGGLQEFIPLSTNEFLMSKADFSPEGQFRSIGTHFKSKKVCAEVAMPIKCDCEVGSTANKDLPILDFKKIILKTACSKEYNKKDWEGLTDNSASGLKEAEASLFMKRFAKPGGFNPEKDLGVLLGLIESKMYQKYPADFKNVMYGVLNSSELLYEGLIKRFPQLKNISGSTENNSCLTKSEQSVLQKKAKDYISKKLKETRPLTADTLEPLISLSKDIFSDEQKTALSVQMTEALVPSIAQSPELKGIFPSKIYKFAINEILKKMDMPNNDITDLTVVRDNDSIKFVTMGVKPFEGSKLTLGGFHVNHIKQQITPSSIPLGETLQHFGWNYGGKNFSADVSLTKGEVSELAPANKKPNYEEMWKKKVFRGLVIAGQNLGAETTQDVMGEYIEYYIDQGFTINKTPKDIPDLNKYLESKISGDEPIHYFIKEAHSDGDEKNLFRITKNGKLLQGIKKVGDKTEIVDIVFPGDSTESLLIANSDFGKWMQNRDKAGSPELIYLNSSCWSATKAIYEVSAAKTPKLINIPSATMMTTFSNENDSALKIILQGIRDKKSYEEMREDLQVNKGYSSHQEDVMIFPDEELYQTNLRNHLKIPVDIDTKVFVGSGKEKVPYSIEAH